MSGAGPCIPSCFRRFPGAVLQLSGEGVILDSNGRLEAELGREVRGQRFAALLDEESSRAKWERMMADAARGEAVADGRELVLHREGSLSEPRRFSLLPEDESDLFWLFEHRSDPRLDDLRDRVVGVNSELTRTQRELVKERARLSSALAELEILYRRTEELARRVQEQNVELRRSNAALDEFAHVVSHDLRAPLRGIANYATWLQEDVGADLPAESAEHLSRLRDRAERMSAMVSGVLDYARAGRTRAQPEPVDVGTLAEEVVAMLDPPPGVEVRIERPMPTLVTERAPLRQVLMNLIGNAVRYARPAGDAVRVRAVEAGAFQEFSVADNGPGVPPGAQDRIWALFQTVEPEESGGGTGIGLSVVKALVEARGGRVWVESGPGGGATFRFLWPGDSTVHPVWLTYNAGGTR